MKVVLNFSNSTSQEREEPCEEALSLNQEMKQSGFQPCQSVYSGVILACARLRFVEEGKEIHEEIIKRDYEFHISVANSLMDMYAKCGCIENAQDLFAQMHQRGVISWNTMITGLEQNGYDDESLKLSQQMHLAVVKSNSKTFATMLSACAKLVALRHGREIHVNVIRNGFLSNVVVANTMITIYEKCRSIEQAHKLFAEMHSRPNPEKQPEIMW